MMPMIRARWLILVQLLWVSAAWCGESSHEIFFAHTSSELHVYRISGRQPGPTMLIIGGIQGNEPGGFLAADRYVDLTLRRGNLILVPRANFFAIIKNRRGPDGDMNRHFRDAAPRNRVERVVGILKELMAEADYLLNLHDGSGFYSPRWEGPKRNPRRYGQSIIADAARYVDLKRGRLVELETLARRVIHRVNVRISEKAHHFKFNNHRTLERDTLHPEQRRSATCYALTHFGIPAYGVETSKDIGDKRLRVEYQTLVINAFLEEVGIIPDHPPLRLAPPRLRFLLVSVNDGYPLAVPDGGRLRLRETDAIELRGVVANCQRGISADVVGLGSINDLQRRLRIRKPTSILVRKEGEVFGRVRVLIAEDGRRPWPGGLREPRLKYFIVELNNKKRLVENHGVLEAVQGDHLRIVDVITEGIDPRALKVNFIGFVGDARNNRGEDRGYLVRTAGDLWTRYALDKAGLRYRIAAVKGKTLLGDMVLDLRPPRLLYMVIARDGASPVCHMSGSVLKAGPSEQIRILDVRTNVPDNLHVGLKVKGDGARLRKAREGWWILEPTGDGSGAGEIVVTREGIPMGTVPLKRS